MFLRTSSLRALVLLSIVSAASAQETPHGRLGDRIRLDLLRSPEVRKELAVSEEQTKEIEEAFAPLDELSGGTREAQNPSPEEQQKRFEERQKKGAAATKLVAEKVDHILNHQQRARLKQLWLQRLRAIALIQPEVVEALGLTEAQQDKIREIRKVVENHLQPATINPPPGQPVFRIFPKRSERSGLTNYRRCGKKNRLKPWPC